MTAASGPEPGGLRPRWADALALVVGAAHAVGVRAVVEALDYPIGGLAVAPGGTAGALVGLTLLLAVPAALAGRHGLVVPLVAAVAGAGWPVYRELATPAPTFSTLGGHTVVAGVRYVDAYVDAWYVWLFSYLLLALAEYVVRTDAARLPAPRSAPRLDRALRRDARAALRAGLLVGLGHAVVLLGLAADAGYFEPGGFLPSPWYVGLGVLAWTVVGLVVVGGLPAALLARWRLVAPTVALAWLVGDTGWTQQLPLPDDALPVYFLGWFTFAGGLVVAGAVEVGLRRARRLTAGDR